MGGCCWQCQYVKGTQPGKRTQSWAVPPKTSIAASRHCQCGPPPPPTPLPWPPLSTTYSYESLAAPARPVTTGARQMDTVKEFSVAAGSNMVSTRPSHPPHRSGPGGSRLVGSRSPRGGGWEPGLRRDVQLLRRVADAAPDPGRPRAARQVPEPVPLPAHHRRGGGRAGPVEAGAGRRGLPRALLRRLPVRSLWVQRRSPAQPSRPAV